MTRCRLIAALVFVAPIVVAACSDSITGTQIGQNEQLAARFDSVLNGLGDSAPPLRAPTLIGLINLLSAGAPVQSIRLTLDGQTRTVSAVGAYLIPSEGTTPVADSSYQLFAWLGDRADTVVAFQASTGITVGQLVTADSAFSSVTGSHTVTAGVPQGACPVHTSSNEVPRVHTLVVAPPPGDCTLEVTTATFDATMTNAADSSRTHEVAVPTQPVSGLRLDVPSA